MKWNMGIGFSPLMKKSSDSWSSYLTSHSDFWGVGRSGLTIPDVHGNDAKILPSVAFMNNASWYYRGGTPFAPTDATGFIEAMVYVDQSTITYILASTTTTTSTRYILFSIQADGKAVFQLREPTAAPVVFTCAYRTTDALSVGWHKVKVGPDGAGSFKITVDDIDVAGGYVSGSGYHWFAEVASAFRVNIGIGGKTQSNTTDISDVGKIAWVNYNDTNKWILHGQGLWAYDTIGAFDIAWVGNPSYTYDEHGSTNLLDSGYSVFKKTGQLDEYVPYKADGTKRTDAGLATYLSTYTRYVDRDGSLTKHNLAPSVIDFDPLDSAPAGVALFNRSDATVWKDACRAATDYDAANTYRWFAENIADPTIYQAWLETAYADKVLSRITQEDEVILTLDEILGLK